MKNYRILFNGINYKIQVRIFIFFFVTLCEGNEDHELIFNTLDDAENYIADRKKEYRKDNFPKYNIVEYI